MAALTVENIPSPQKDETTGNLDVLVLTENAAASAGDTVANDGRVIIMCRNTHGSATRTITFGGVVGPTGRDGDVVMTLTTGKIGIAGPFEKALWNSSGNITVTYSDSGADIKVGAMRYL